MVKLCLTIIGEDRNNQGLINNYKQIKSKNYTKLNQV